LIQFDYAEAERSEDGGWDVHVGLQFADEPGELYAAHVRIGANGDVRGIDLFFNGMNCRYEWRDGEREALLQYVRDRHPEILP
jgi:hypothetical protein